VAINGGGFGFWSDEREDADGHAGSVIEALCKATSREYCPVDRSTSNATRRRNFLKTEWPKHHIGILEVQCRLWMEDRNVDGHARDQMDLMTLMRSAFGQRW
jgi:hypothetical protein